jgi:hypothetical protein
MDQRVGSGKKDSWLFGEDETPVDYSSPARNLNKNQMLQCIQMAKIAVHLTLEELQTVLTMTDNQLFRLKYIDPKLPGHINRPEELHAAQSVVQIFKDAFKEAKGFKTNH